MSRAVFRVDASAKIGSGHLSRCLTLADCLRERGVESIFICHELPNAYHDLLAVRGHSVEFIGSEGSRLEEESDADSTLAALRKFAPVEYLVIDHYALNMTWESRVRRSAEKTLVIDDLVGRPHDCDLLLNQNYRVEPGNPYASLIPEGAQTLLGPRYALLRPQFAEARRVIKARSGLVRRVFVCFGGSDQLNYGAAALTALQPFAKELDRIDVVLGPSNTHLDDIVERCRGMSNVLVHRDVNDIEDLLAEADLAIGAGGAMNWERACLGVPTLVFGIAANQQPVLAALIESGIVLGESDMATPDPGVISSWLQCVLGNAALLRGLSHRSANLVDGHGVQRVANALLSPRIEFRHATERDSNSIYEWRNDPAVRNLSLDIREISISSHRKWFKQSLLDSSRILLIAECAGSPVGVVRFDLCGKQAEVSVYTVPSRMHQRNGLIQSATRWLCRQDVKIDCIVAQILPENVASLAAFRKAGYHDSQYALVYKVNRRI